MTEKLKQRYRMNLNSSDIAEALSADDFSISAVLFKENIRGISFDTRTLKKGDLFFALQSNTGDGHAHVFEAIAKGAVAAVVERAIDGVTMQKMVIVPSPLEALGRLSAYIRRKSPAFNIAITGSVGKTTIKELLAHILKNFGETIYSKESFNNHIGVPYSLCQLTPSTRYGVFEIGMNRPGEIGPLSNLVRPKIAIITNIEPSHIGPMGHLHAIAYEKSDIFIGVDSPDSAVLPRDAEHFDLLLKRAKMQGIKHIFTFGKHADSDVRLVSSERTLSGNKVKVTMDGAVYGFEIQLPGEHSSMNALLAFFVCIKAGLKASDIIPHLGTFKPIKGRGQQFKIRVKDQNILLIDDAYNANPTSMRAGLSMLAFTPKDAHARRIAVLGDMKELGDGSADYHRALALVIRDLEIDCVFVAGEDMAHLFEALEENQKGAYAKTPQDLLPKLLETLKNGDIVFFKGSKSSQISTLVDQLLHEGEKV